MLVQELVQVQVLGQEQGQEQGQVPHSHKLHLYMRR
jgi:hypothetical protein